MSLAVPELEVERAWAAWLVDRNRRGARIVLALAAVLFPLFAGLDVLAAPRRWLWLLFASRATVAALTLATMTTLRRPLFERHWSRITAAHIVVCGFGIIVMVVAMGGFHSPYYAGLTLVLVGAGLLYVWPRPVIVTTHAVIVVAYVVANLFVPSRGALVVGVSNLFFLASAAIIVSAGQIFSYRSAREQLVNQLTLERTKANLEIAHEQLKQLDRFKSEFFANITHELKTPLAMILSPLELLLGGELGELHETQRATLRSMFRSGVKLLKLIDDLLDLSRLEESRIRLKVAEHDLVGYLRGLVTQVQPLAQRKGITMTFAADAARSAVHCDLERLERVFINLLSNAAKFTPDGGQVAMRLRDGPTSAVVEVQDNGPGFPPAMAERIFERFFQVDMGGSRRYGGAGIGLALAREIVELHGGRIRAEGAPGQGATFTVELLKDREHFRPEVIDRRTSRKVVAAGQRTGDRGLIDWSVQLAARDDFRLLDIAEATERRVVERDPDENARGQTVLVVEDTPDVIRVIHLTLRQRFKVMAATDGEKGLELALRERPSLIITDLMMPGLDGLELTRRLRADPRTAQTPIVMLTARSDLDDRLAGLETGVNAYLAKPFSGKELLATVRKLLDMNKATADALLARQMDSLESIAGGLAHEINNPLNYLKNAVTRIRMDLPELLRLAREPVAEAKDLRRLEQIEARATRMFQTAEAGIARIADTVALMTRYSREGFTRAPRPHDLFAAAADVVGIVLPATGRNVQVETRFEGDGTVQGVPEELHQVLTNLVQNAIEAAPDDGSGRVYVHGEARGAEVLLRVRDNGAGIRPEDRARIFTPFFTTKEPGRGMGLGLTITWRVVQGLGGTIDVESSAGQGTEFVVRLPRAPAAPSGTAASAEAHLAGP